MITQSDFGQSIKIVLGISTATLALMTVGGVSQILKHKQNPYQKAGAKSTTIHALLGLALSFVVILLLKFLQTMNVSL